MLMMPNKEVWTFSAHEDRVELEDSVYLAGSDGPRRTAQIVITAMPAPPRACSGACSRPTVAAPAPRPPPRHAALREEEPRLPL